MMQWLLSIKSQGSVTSLKINCLKFQLLKTIRNYYPNFLIDLDETSKIALCTLPPIGENKDSAINEHVRKFNDFIELTAKIKTLTLFQSQTFYGMNYLKELTQLKVIMIQTHFQLLEQFMAE